MISVAPNHEVHAIRELTGRIEQLEVSAMRTKNDPHNLKDPNVHAIAPPVRARGLSRECVLRIPSVIVKGD